MGSEKWDTQSILLRQARHDRQIPGAMTIIIHVSDSFCRCHPPQFSNATAETIPGGVPRFSSLHM